MNRFFAILILGVMIFRPILPFFEYAWRYDYIIKVLCENRNEPLLECDGKCHLTKQLSVDKSSDDDKRRAPSNSQIEVSFNLFCTSTTDQELALYATHLNERLTYKAPCYAFLPIDDWFEPPRS